MIDKELIRKYNVAGPRYTSYPPANYFSDSFSQEKFIHLLDRSNKKEPQSISLYLHIPFCPQICYFCGCNTSLYKDKNTVDAYFEALITEITLVAEHLNKKRKVTQIHWGGGTPNSVSFKWIEKVMNIIRQKFTVLPQAEVAMECNPAYLELTDLVKLNQMGFNRISIGVQDFNHQILKGINRIPSKYPLEDVNRTAKKSGFKGVNIDLIYGLPGQQYDDFIESVKRALKISPERLVTFSYAHVPWFKKHQKKLEKYYMPGPDEKLEMLESSFDMITNAGYQAIGMDHYAKPGDELYVALQNKELHRNFQGYCTRETTGQVYAFGATAISQLTDGYSQNSRSIKEYSDTLKKGNLPVLRGYILNEQEKMIREVINETMCNHYVDFQEIAGKYQLSAGDLKKILNFQPEKLRPFIEDGLVEFNDNKLSVNSRGFFLIRNIAMALDTMLENKKNQYSKTI